MILIYFAIIWLIIFSWLFHTVIFKYLKYTEYVIDIPKEWQPFQRQDRKKWNIPQMFIVGYFLLLPRMICFLTTMLITAQTYKILGFAEKDNFSKVYPKWKRVLLKRLVQVYGFLLLFFGGFIWPTFKKESIQKYDKSYVEPKKKDFKDGKPPITVSNHVSWADPLVMQQSNFNQSMLTKKEIEKMPVYGTIQRGMQNLGIDRKCKDNKDFILKKIKERAEDIRSGKDLNSIHIYPEGTTTSGRELISFKKGAFEALLPIGIICLNYTANNCNPSIDIDEPFSLFIMMCQLWNKLEFIDLGTYYPEGNLKFKGDENDWEIYADKVKDIMCKCLGLRNSQSGFRHYQEYEKIRKKTYGPKKYVYQKKEE